MAPPTKGKDLANLGKGKTRGVDLSQIRSGLLQGREGLKSGVDAAKSFVAGAGRPFNATDAERFGPLVPNLEGAGMPASSTLSMPGTPSRGRVDAAIRQIAADRAAAEGLTNRYDVRSGGGGINPFAGGGVSTPVRPSTDYGAADIGSLGALVQATGNSPRCDPQTGIAAALARATQPTGLGGLEGEKLRSKPRGQGFNALNIDLDAILKQANKLSADYVPPKVIVEEDPPKVIVEEDPPKVIVEEDPPGPAPVGDTIRSLYGELSTRDFSNMIRNMMAERETNLRGLNQQSVDQLAASVLRRTGQIGDIKAALETELGVLDADRAGVQQGLVDAVALRAQEMQAGTDASLTAAREGLGDQVTDEFEKVAQIVGSQAASQATSSQDAMARLAQVADMAAAERLAAPAQLASEAELALGDEEFAYTQALQSNLTEALAGLDAEEAERVLGEAMRQENFNIGRDQRMIEALVGDLVRKDTQAFQAGQAQLGRDFSADQAQLGRDFSAGQSALSRAFSGQQSALSRAFQTSEREASQRFKSEQAEIVRAANEDAARLQREAAQIAADAEAADDKTAADLYKVDVALWRQMGATERESLREDWIETQRLAGIGQEAFPAGMIQNLQQKYPKLDSDFFVHVNALLGIDAMNGNYAGTVKTEEEAKKAAELRKQYLEGLRTTDAFGAKGLTVAETSMIDTLYAELFSDLTDAERASRQATQLEMSSISQRR